MPGCTLIFVKARKTGKTKVRSRSGSGDEDQQPWGSIDEVSKLYNPASITIGLADDEYVQQFADRPADARFDRASVNG